MLRLLLTSRLMSSRHTETSILRTAAYLIPSQPHEQLHSLGSTASGWNLHHSFQSSMYGERSIAARSRAPCGSQSCSRACTEAVRSSTTAAGPSNLSPQQIDEPADTALPPGKHILYKGRWLQPFRLLVRLKLFQLAGVATLAVPINTFLSQGSVEGLQVAVAGGLLVGCGIASTTLWYYSRRYVGELSVHADRPGLVCLSVMDFWGNREDNTVLVGDIKPPLQGLSRAAWVEEAAQPLLPLEVTGDRQYVISLRHGHLLDRAALRQLLEGSLPAKPPPPGAQQRWWQAIADDEQLQPREL